MCEKGGKKEVQLELPVMLTGAPVHFINFNCILIEHLNITDVFQLTLYQRNNYDASFIDFLIHTNI